MTSRISAFQQHTAEGLEKCSFKYEACKKNYYVDMHESKANCQYQKTQT